MELIPGLTNDLARECLIRVPFQSLCSIISVCKAWNSEIQSLKFHFDCRLSRRSRPFLLIPLSSITNSYSIACIDQLSGSITLLPPGPVLPFKDLPIFFQLAGVGSKVVVCITAGQNGMYNVLVHVFDCLTGGWRVGATMPAQGRMYYGLAGDPLGGKCLVAGGVNANIGSAFDLRSTFLYDVASDTWEALGDLKYERVYCEVMFYGGKFYAIGGIPQPDENGICRMPPEESLDPNTWQWGSVVEAEDETLFHDICSSGTVYL